MYFNLSTFESISVRYNKPLQKAKQENELQTKCRANTKKYKLYRNPYLRRIQRPVKHLIQSFSKNS